MRENRPCGSEGGVGQHRSRPLSSIPVSVARWVPDRLATLAVRDDSGGIGQDDSGEFGARLKPRHHLVRASATLVSFDRWPAAENSPAATSSRGNPTRNVLPCSCAFLV